MGTIPRVSFLQDLGCMDTACVCDFASELRELCVKVEVAVLGSTSLIVLTVSVDVKQH